MINYIVQGFLMAFFLIKCKNNLDTTCRILGIIIVNFSILILSYLLIYDSRNVSWLDLTIITHITLLLTGPLYYMFMVSLAGNFSSLQLLNLVPVLLLVLLPYNIFFSNKVFADNIKYFATTGLLLIYFSQSLVLLKRFTIILRLSQLNSGILNVFKVAAIIIPVVIISTQIIYIISDSENAVFLSASMLSILMYYVSYKVIKKSNFIYN